MRHPLDSSSRAFALACSMALVIGCVPPPPAPTAPAAQGYTYVGTVHAVQPAMATMDLITGVGHSLRMMHMSMAPGARAMRGTTTISLSDIAPGDIVRAQCHMTPAGPVADQLEELDASGSTPGRAP
jgi:hypothetical protein